jgi:hypothetical protein
LHREQQAPFYRELCAIRTSARQQQQQLLEWQRHVSCTPLPAAAGCQAAITDFINNLQEAPASSVADVLHENLVRVTWARWSHGSLGLNKSQCMPA